jgi:hypothetical protein
VNVNDVDVVPLPGVAAPFSIVIWPHVRASAGLANAPAPTINPPANAQSTTRIDRDRARAGPRIGLRVMDPTIGAHGAAGP